MLEVRPGRRIVYIEGASKVKAFKLSSVWTQAVKAVRKEFEVTSVVAVSVKTQEKKTTHVKLLQEVLLAGPTSVSTFPIVIR